MSAPDGYFQLSNKDKADVLKRATTVLQRPSQLLEKDIWIVWTLNTLFSSEFGDHLVFKGGTSLSKVHKVIDRFSEDVDITYDIRQMIPDLVENPDDPYPPTSSQARKWTKAVRARLPEWIRESVVPVLSNRIESEVLPVASLKQEDDKLFLNFDPAFSGTDYVRSVVLLEFGARSTGEPAGVHEVHCDISEALPDIQLPSAIAKVMNAERTFWEKAAAVHTYCLKGTFRGGDRYARHWFDLDCLDKAGLAKAALDDRSLGEDVVRHQQIFFREKAGDGEFIDYGDVVQGKLCLVPAGEPLLALEEDYNEMVEAKLFFNADVSPFSELIERILLLQNRANVIGTAEPAASPGEDESVPSP